MYLTCVDLILSKRFGCTSAAFGESLVAWLPLSFMWKISTTKIPIQVTTVSAQYLAVSQNHPEIPYIFVAQSIIQTCTKWQSKRQDAAGWRQDSIVCQGNCTISTMSNCRADKNLYVVPVMDDLGSFDRVALLANQKMGCGMTIYQS